MSRVSILAVTAIATAGFMAAPADDEEEGRRVGNLVVVDGDKREVEANVGDVLQINFSYAVRPPMPKNLKVEVTRGLKKMRVLKASYLRDGVPERGKQALAALITVEKAGDATVTITPVGAENQEPIKYTVKVTDAKDAE